MRTLVAGPVIALPVVTMVRIHPFEYTYFNQLAGGHYARDNHWLFYTSDDAYDPDSV